MPINSQQPDSVVALLAGKLLYTLALFALRLGTLARRRSALRMSIGIVRAGWIMAVVLFPLAKASGYYAIISVMAAIAVALLAVAVMLEQVYALMRSNRRPLLPAVLVAVLAAVLYLLPYVVWSQGGIPFYTTAMLYVLVLVAAALIVGRLYLRRFLYEPSTRVDDTNVPASP